MGLDWLWFCSGTFKSRSTQPCAHVGVCRRVKPSVSPVRINKFPYTVLCIFEPMTDRSTMMVAFLGRPYMLPMLEQELGNSWKLMSKVKKRVWRQFGARAQHQVVNVVGWLWFCSGTSKPRSTQPKHMLPIITPSCRWDKRVSWFVQGGQVLSGKYFVDIKVKNSALQLHKQTTRQRNFKTFHKMFSMSYWYTLYI